jgi:hypothetical protein
MGVGHQQSSSQLISYIYRVSFIWLKTKDKSNGFWLKSKDKNKVIWLKTKDSHVIEL